MNPTRSTKDPRQRLAWSVSIALLAVAMVSGFMAATPVLAQGADVTLVNADREFVERKKDGEFVARPIFDRRVEFLYYGLRDTMSGDWLTGMYRVQGGEKELASGWEYSFEYPALDEHPELDPEQLYLMVIIATAPGQDPVQFNTLVPVYQPTGLWERVMQAFNPETWARAILTWDSGGSPPRALHRRGEDYRRRRTQLPRGLKA